MHPALPETPDAMVCPVSLADLVARIDDRVDDNPMVSDWPGMDEQFETLCSGGCICCFEMPAETPSVQQPLPTTYAAAMDELYSLLIACVGDAPDASGNLPETPREQTDEASDCARCRRAEAVLAILEEITESEDRCGSCGKVH